MGNIIFDWSGVIKDNLENHLWIVNRMFQKYGIKKINLEELKGNWKQPYMDFYNKYLPDMTLSEEQNVYKEGLRDKNGPKTKPYPGITEFVRRLKQKKHFLAVVSSDFPETLIPEIKSFGLENIFEEAITNVHNKTKAIKDLIKTVAVTWGFNTEVDLALEKPDFIAHNLKELKNALISHGKTN